MRGTKVGNYSVTSELGEGGMGKVYVAEHGLMEKRAAIKVLLPEYSKNDELVTRFFNEARAASRVSHPGIVDIYDFGYLDDGSAYIVMELLEGEPLKAVLDREAPLAPERVARLGGQIADALAAAHATGIIHRDLKPDNVFLVADTAVAGGERAKLLDFGIAKLGGDNSVSLKTRTGALMGTPTYMSPEQCRGSAELDWRSDIYSAGCIMFEMTAGRPPFTEGGLGELLAAHMMQEPPRVTEFSPTAPDELASTIAWMLAKDPADRPQSMREVVEVMGPLAGSTMPPRVPTVPPAGHTEPPQGPTPTTLGGAAGQRGDAAKGPPRRWITIGLATGGTLAAAAVVSAFVLAGGEESGDETSAAADPDEDVSAAAAAPPDAGSEPDEEELAEAEDAFDAAPAPPETVTIAIDSVPPEARVTDADSGDELGHTPLEIEREREDGELTLAIAKDAYQDEALSVSLDEDAEATVELEGVPRPARQRPAQERPSGSSSEPQPDPEPDPQPSSEEKDRGWGDILD